MIQLKKKIVVVNRVRKFPLFRALFYRRGFLLKTFVMILISPFQFVRLWSRVGWRATSTGSLGSSPRTTSNSFPNTRPSFRNGPTIEDYVHFGFVQKRLFQNFFFNTRSERLIYDLKTSLFSFCALKTIM